MNLTWPANHPQGLPRLHQGQSVVLAKSVPFSQQSHAGSCPSSGPHRAHIRTGEQGRPSCCLGHPLGRRRAQLGRAGSLHTLDRPNCRPAVEGL